MNREGYEHDIAAVRIGAPLQASAKVPDVDYDWEIELVSEGSVRLRKC